MSHQIKTVNHQSVHYNMGDLQEMNFVPLSKPIKKPDLDIITHTNSFNLALAQEKVIKKIKLKNKDNLPKLQKEFEDLYAKKIPNLLEYQSIYIEDDQLFLITNYYQNLDNFTTLNEEPLEENQARDLLKQIINVYYHLNQNLKIDIEDLNIKNENIYIYKKSQVLVSDFNFCQYTKKKYLQLSFQCKSQDFSKQTPGEFKFDLGKVIGRIYFQLLFGIKPNLNDVRGGVQLYKIPFEKKISLQTRNFLDYCFKHQCTFPQLKEQFDTIFSKGLTKQSDDYFLGQQKDLNKNQLGKQDNITQILEVVQSLHQLDSTDKLHKLKQEYEDKKYQKVDFDQFFDWFKKEITDQISQKIVGIIFNFVWLYRDNMTQNQFVSQEEIQLQWRSCRFDTLTKNQMVVEEEEEESQMEQPPKIQNTTEANEKNNFIHPVKVETDSDKKKEDATAQNVHNDKRSTVDQKEQEKHEKYMESENQTQKNPKNLTVDTKIGALHHDDDHPASPGKSGSPRKTHLAKKKIYLYDFISLISDFQFYSYNESMKSRNLIKILRNNLEYDRMTSHRLNTQQEMFHLQLASEIEVTDFCQFFIDNDFSDGVSRKELVNVYEFLVLYQPGECLDIDRTQLTKDFFLQVFDLDHFKQRDPLNLYTRYLIRCVRSQFHRFTYKKQKFEDLIIKKTVEKEHDKPNKKGCIDVDAVKEYTVIFFGLAIAYSACYLSMGDQFLPFKEVFTLSFLLVSAHIFGKLFTFIHLPALLGMLLTGLVYRQIIVDEDDDEDLLSGIPDKWSSKLRYFALAVIMVRSGLGIDVEKLKKSWKTVFNIALIPCVIEAIVLGVFAGLLIFKEDEFSDGKNFLIACVLGFIMSAVSPAVVVSAMFNLQSQYYGAKNAVPSLVIASASIDDVIAIIGYSLFLGFAIPVSDDQVLDIISGPISLVCGVVLGVIFGLIMGCTSFFNTTLKRSAVMFFLTTFTMFFFKKFKAINLSSAGAIGALVMGITANVCWKKGKPGIWGLSKGANPDYIPGVQKDLNLIWMYICQPLLFSLIGASVKFRDIDSSIIPKSIGIVFIGITFRVIGCYFTLNSQYTRNEKILISISWIPKATVQAALASVPLDLIKEKLTEADDGYQSYVDWGNKILTTGLFAIILTAPLGLVMLNKLGKKLLTQDLPPEKKIVQHGIVKKENCQNSKIWDLADEIKLMNEKSNQGKGQEINQELLKLRLLLKKQQIEIKMRWNSDFIRLMREHNSDINSADFQEIMTEILGDNSALSKEDLNLIYHHFSNNISNFYLNVM